MSKLENVITERTYREVAEQRIREASTEVGKTVVAVAFEPDGEWTEQHAWSCFLIDPRRADLDVGPSRTSAVDHFERQNPNGFLDRAPDRIRVSIFELVVSYEAAIEVREEDGDGYRQFPTWQMGLAVVRATFNWTSVE